MYKGKLNILNSTWVWLKYKFQLKPPQQRMYKVKLNFFEFDLSLTKIQISSQNQRISAFTKSNSIFWSWLEFD